MKTSLLAFVIISASLGILSAADPAADYVVHEWGTFTSVQGADGVQMIWNPQIAPDLPKFVYDVMHPHPAMLKFVVAGKTGTAQRQRMETPVIYFYSDQARTVDVSVRFPEGTVTEWYPLESAADPRDPLMRRAMGNDGPVLHWPKVRILPTPSGRESALPQDASGSHYYAARETDSSPLVVLTEDQKTETEKFLFYRGLASFKAPLTVKLDPADPKRLVLTNTGGEALGALFIYEVRPDGGSWLGIEGLKPGESRSVSLDLGAGAHSLTVADRSIATATQLNGLHLNNSVLGALIKEGLYPREAMAMVKTWEDTWFAEPGLRVIYTLPRAWTDRTLPLSILPTPKSVERVMIARAEVITPAMERALLGKVEQYVAATPGERRRIVDETRALGLGRFIGPTLTRVLHDANRPQDFVTLSWQLVQAAMAAPTLPATASAN
jgi:hypothetical protein